MHSRAISLLTKHGSTATIVVAAALLAFGAVPFSWAQEEQTAYYCVYLNTYSKVSYYSEVFLSTEGSVMLSTAFDGYVRSHYSTPPGSSTCSRNFSDRASLKRSRSDRDEDAARWKSEGYKIEWTEWTY